jgi:hypothetical protein
LAFVVVTLFGCGSASREMPIVPEAPIQSIAAPKSPRIEQLVSLLDGREAPADAPPPLSWGALYARYFGHGTAGHCGGGRGCHANVMTDAASAYGWLAQRGYIAGTQSPLVSPTNSCLRWFGGNMPPRGAESDEAVRDFTAWVAEGALNN